MELSFKTLSLLLGIILTGLTAGLCYTWSNAITPGIGSLDDHTFLKSFQAMNRAIINPSFILVFFGPVILLFLNAYWFRNTSPITFWSFLIAALVFFIGVSVVTVSKNVPLNEILDRSILEVMSKQELAQLRKTFEEPWNRWHWIRTLSSIASLILLLMGSFNLK
ncbi:DUF1772 domain-containing protein [bacterium SCSIO 12741]|nr:DUF1772 domain-containing protein [bacterium SCSIO 12741]